MSATSSPARFRPYLRAPLRETSRALAPTLTESQSIANGYSAVGLSGPTATFTVEGAVDTTIFNIYVELI
jgi:hypothetical protein